MFISFDEYKEDLVSGGAKSKEFIHDRVVSLLDDALISKSISYSERQTIIDDYINSIGQMFRCKCDYTGFFVVPPSKYSGYGITCCPKCGLIEIYPPLPRPPIKLSNMTCAQAFAFWYVAEALDDDFIQIFIAKATKNNNHLCPKCNSKNLWTCSGHSLKPGWLKALAFFTGAYGSGLGKSLAGADLIGLCENCGRFGAV